MVEKIANKTTDKELIFKIYKQLMQLNTRKINDPIKNWAKELNGHSPRKTHMRLTNTWKVMLSIAHYQSSSVQSLSRVQLFVTPWTAARQASLSITNSWSLLKLMSIKSVMPSNHLILCRPLLLLPSIFPSIGAFSKESALHIRWPQYWSFSFSISPSSEYSGPISSRMDWLDLLAVQGTLKSLH